MNAVVYKELSDVSESVAIESGRPLFDSFEGLNPESCVFLVNGEEKTPDYIVKEGDIVMVRLVPKGVTAIVVGVIVAAAVGAAVYTGYQAYQLRKQVEEMQERMKGINESVANLPDLKGARNAIATGKTMPYIIGEHLFTPYKLMNSFYTISGEDGEDQYYHVLLEAGFAKQVVRKMFCDDITLKDFGTSETVPQEGVYDFDYIDTYGSPFYDAKNKIEIRQGTDFATITALNEKVVHEEINLEIKKFNEDGGEYLTLTLPESTYKFQACMTFNGLIQFSTSTGAKENRTLQIEPGYSLDGGATWKVIPWTGKPWIGGTSGTTITRRTVKQMRFTVSKIFTWNEVKDLTSPIMIRFICLTSAYDGSAYDDVFVSWVKSNIFDKAASTVANAIVAEKPIADREKSLSTLIGMKIKATDSNQDKLSMINMITSGVARTWNGSSWSSTRVPTRNPAAWLLEVLTSSSHNPSKCEDSEIDLESFGELYTYCETNELNCDMVITDGDTKENILNVIGQTCYASLYRNVYGTMSAVWDAKKTDPVALLNSQRLIGFDSRKDLSRLTDGIWITFTNRDAGYVKDSYLIMRNGVERGPGSLIRDVTVNGITDFKQIAKYAHRIMNIEAMRPKTCMARVGKEGQYYSLLSLVYVQHSSLKRGLGSATIKELIYNEAETQIIGLKLYEPIQYVPEDGNHYIFVHVVNSSQSEVYNQGYTSSETGMTDTISLVTPVDLSTDTVYPWPGNVLSYGIGSADVVSQMLITGIEADATGYVLTLVDYSDDVYSSYDAPNYTPSLQQPKLPYNFVTSQAATKEELAAVKEEISTGGEIYVPDNVGAVTAVAYRDYIEVSFPWNENGLGNTVQYFDVEIDKGAGFVSYAQIKNNLIQIPFNRDVDGYPSSTTLSDWMLRVRAVNVYGKTSQSWGPTPAGIPIDTTIYGTWSPTAPVMSTRVNGRGISIGWAYNGQWYGVGDAQLQIAKGYTVSGGEVVPILDTGTLEWYAPAIGLDPAANYENYKEGTLNGYLERGGNAFFVSVPLYGQNENPITSRDTPYYIRARSTSRQPTTSNPNAFDASAWSTPQLVYAHASGAQDVVRAWRLTDSGEKVKVDGALGAQQIYAEFLAAISANLGVITDGAMVGNENNLWALSRIYDDDGVTVKYYEGTVKMGGTDQYLHVTPLITNGVIVGYNIDFRVGNFTVTAVGSIVNGSFEVRNKRGDRTYFIVDPANAGRIDIKNTLSVGSSEMPNDRITAKDGTLVTGTLFDGDGIDDMEVLSDGTSLGTFDVEIVDNWYEVAAFSGILVHDAMISGSNIAIIGPGAGDTTTIYRSTDDGATWLSPVAGLPGKPLYIREAPGKIIVVTTTDIMFVTGLFGPGGIAYGSILSLDRGVEGFDVLGDVAILTLNNGAVYISTDGCYSFTNTYTGAGKRLTVPLILEDKIIAYSEIGYAINVSTDGGYTWESNLGTYSWLHSFARGNGYLLAFTNNAVYRSEDNADTWTPIAAVAGTTYGLVSGIANDIVYISEGGASGKTIAISLDKGASFFKSQTLGNKAISSFAFGSPYGLICAGGKLYKAASYANQTARWRYNSGSWSANFIIGPGLSQEFSPHGASVGFANAFGHVVGDSWSFVTQKIGSLSALDENGDEYFALRAGYARSTKPILAPSILVDCSSRVAEYTGDGGSATIKDRAGNGNNLTATNVTYTNGKYGKEMSFNGATSYLQASSPVIGTTGTTSVRFKCNVVSGTHIVYNNYASTVSGVYLFINAGVVSFRLNPQIVQNIATISAGTYYTFTVKWDGSNIYIYQNGVLIKTEVQTSAHVIGTRGLVLGADAGLSANFFNGIISHFRYDNRIWTDEECLRWSLNPISQDSRI